MNQQPDSFFRKKFEGFQKPVPASAWEKIAAAQARKNNKGIWLKIAASLLLLAVVTYGLWSITTTEEKMAAVQNLPPATQPDSTEDLPEQIDEATVDPQDEAKELPKKSAAPIKAETRTNEPFFITGISTDTAKSISISTPESREALPDAIVDSTLLAYSYPPVNESITLVFTVTEANEYLNKKELSDATDSTKKTSRLKKLLKKANDLTSNQDPFGELRQKKNEILALNFKNEKQRGQNK